MDDSVTIAIPYIGGVLSVNRYTFHGGHKIRPQVSDWMDTLAGRASELFNGREVPDPLIVRLSATFRDNRVPDLANLHKVIGDALQRALPLNDRFYRFVDEGYAVDATKEPTLYIRLGAR